MPYIEQKYRGYWDLRLDPLLAVLGPWISKGTVNYVLTRIIIEAIGDRVNYERISEMMGVLIDVQGEVGRRLLYPYEDSKIKANGDLPWPEVK